MDVKTLVITARPWSFIMTVIVLLSSFIYAAYLGYEVAPLLAALALIGSILLHASVNVINDYFDYKRGVDRPDVGTVKYRIHPIIHGVMSSGSTFKLAAGLAAAALAIGLYITLQDRPLAIALGLLGLALGWGYSLDPPGFKYRGLGELAVFIAFGPVMFAGGFYAATGVLDMRALALSIPLGLMIAAVLLANNIRDADTDSRAGITTLAVILGREKAFILYAAMVFASYLIVAIMVALNLVPPTTLIILASLYTFYNLYATVKRKGIPADFDPRTAKVVTQFGVLLILGITLGIVLGLEAASLYI